MARKFKEAIPLFEARLQKEPHDLPTMENLVVCYLAERDLQRALQLFEFLVAQSSKAVCWKHQESCPCRDVMVDWVKNPPPRMSRLNYLISMGILSLFCEPEISEIYFKPANEIAPNLKLLQQIRMRSSTNEVKQ